MNKEDLKKRTKDFAHRCVNLALNLPNSKLGRHSQGQLFSASTSVAANYGAACLAQSKAGSTAKLSIVIEEASELTAVFVASRKTIQKNK